MFIIYKLVLYLHYKQLISLGFQWLKYSDSHLGSDPDSAKSIFQNWDSDPDLAKFLI